MKYISAFLFAAAISLVFSQRTDNIPKRKESDQTAVQEQHLNKLQYAKSPYLLQHADNPVDWYEWGEEAFEKARSEDKPIFLSIGYSTCHWCHVMEHESFEHEGVAELMNRYFVSIKVDREERPDIDDVYMTVCQMMSQSCGWPLTILMTPDKVPFFAATYIPRESRFGRMGMMELLPRVGDLWQSKRQEIIQAADNIGDALKKIAADVPGAALGQDAVDTAFEQLKTSFDDEHGGFSNAPKFPMPHNLLFLLRHWRKTGESRSLQMAEKTLVAMRRGGMFDHIGFGFHRYSTDALWFTPHFEKMLYDQAMLAMAYTEAFEATRNEEFAAVAREIFTYVLRDMADPGGGFYSAEDADSEGEEGKFYLWTGEEVKQVLGKKEGDLFTRVFNFKPDGNYIEEASGRRSGDNIAHLRSSIPDIAAAVGVAEDELRLRLESARRKLFAHREKRIHPHKDDKILTDWNGLMIAALAKAARAFGEERYAAAAEKAAGFLLSEMRNESGRLLHRYRAGSAGIEAYADDYVFLIWGLLELYETTFKTQYLQTALELNSGLMEHHWDAENGGLFSAADDSEKLLVRKKEFYDGAVPSANSVAMLNLLRLGRITGDTTMDEKAAAIGKLFSSKVNQYPAAFALMLSAVQFGIGPGYEVVIVGDPDADDTKTMLKALREKYLPNKVVLFKPTGEEALIIEAIAGFTASQVSIDGKATAYVCQNFICNLPTTSVSKMLELLGVN